MTVGLRNPATLAEVGSVSDENIPGPAGPLTVRIYRPAGPAPAPTVVFFHGGGFVFGDLDTHDDHARLLCRDVGAVVVSVDYRLAPEHAFPAGFEDCLAATQWAAVSIGRLGGDSARLAVAGDSAGGNLAAAVAQACRDEGLDLAGQLLIYPSTDMRDSGYASRVDNARGYFLTEEDLRWFHGHYLADPADAADPRASVLLTTDLRGLAPAIIGVAGYDPLRDEGVAYGEALEAAGVPVLLRRYADLIHGFFGMGALSPAAMTAVSQLTADLRELLSRHGAPEAYR